jgi:integrase
MPRVATKLTPTGTGGFMARKRVPADVQDEYAKLYGLHAEERLNTGPMTIFHARARHREWSTEIEARFANIRAARKGEGRTLTRKQARALAGEWYEWFTARTLAEEWPAQRYDAWRAMFAGLLAGRSGAALSNAHATIEHWPAQVEDDIFDLWERDSAAREALRPAIAHWAGTAQFLAAKGVNLDPASRDMFLDFVVRDLFAALTLLGRRTRGDYGNDEWAEQFPQPEVGADPSLTAWALFERWAADIKPAANSIERWRGVFRKLDADKPADMQQWAEGLVTGERSAGTVQGVWVIACRTVYAWAVRKKLVGRNPFDGVKVTVPRKVQTRETKSFTDDESSVILKAALAETNAARRWCPWLAAYTGARMGEITQLRGSDIVEQGGVHAIRISPEAGTVKNRRPRTVPLHEHLIEQGFLAFVKANGPGPLFHSGSKRGATSARVQLATWVRSLGITDPELAPNHAWRHTFKAIGARCGISEKLLDAIVGHAPATIGRAYGEPTLADKAAALSKFPRYRP